MRLLIADDSEEHRTAVSVHLRRLGFAVDEVATGREALWLAGQAPFDALLMAMHLPDMSAVEVCQRLRGDEQWTPIMVMTASVHERSCVAALDAGADDFVVKSVGLHELTARIRALIRRGSTARPILLRSGDLVLDSARHQVRRGSRSIALTPRELALLTFLMRHEGHVLSRRQIIERVWDFAFRSDSNVVDVHIRSLRRKIDDPFGTDSIETVRGVGYRLRPAGPEDSANEMNSVAS